MFRPSKRSIVVRRSYADVGTNLFDLAVEPATGALWIVNTDARNLTRFEPQLRGSITSGRPASKPGAILAMPTNTRSSSADFGRPPITQPSNWAPDLA